MLLRHINFVAKMESPIYYAALENVNRGMMNEMEDLIDKAKTI